MPMHTESLSVGDWYELTDLDDDTFAQFWIDGSDPVVVAVEVAEPDAGATGAPCVEGINQVVIPEGKRIFVQLQSGTGDVIYSQFDGLTVTTGENGYGYQDDPTTDNAWVASDTVYVGWDDLTNRAGTEPYEFRGFLKFDSAGVAAAATILNAVLSLYPSGATVGRTVRIYGIASIVDEFVNISSWATLVGLTPTMAYTDVVLTASPTIQADVTTIVDELVNQGGWSGTSPIQFIMEDTGSDVNGQDTRLVIDTTRRGTNLVVLV